MEERRIKITIEGLEEAPIIIEDAKQVILFADNEEATSVLSSSGPIFKGFVAARLLTEISKQLEDNY